MPTEVEAAEITRVYQRQLSTLERGLRAVLAGLWLELGSYDTDDVDRWEQLIDPPTGTAAAEAAAAAVGYVTLIAESRLPAVKPPTPLADPVAPFKRMWRRLDGGQLWEDARKEAVGAVGDYGSEVVHSVARRASDQAADSRQVVGWRRVLVGISCEWCALVSTQRYRTAESADFGHRNCDCTVTPILGDVDPGRVINSELLTKMKAQGTPDRISHNRAARRSMQAAENATRRRDQALAELARETDPQRRLRLENRAQRWQREAEAFRARAADEAARTAKRRLPGQTGYVDPTGEPAPRR